MKTLLLIRHAKSSRDGRVLPDTRRPLTDRGRRDAGELAKRLAKRAVKVDLILSSPALRAVATARIIAKGIDYRRRDIVLDDRVYGGDAAELLRIIRRLDARCRRVMLVGHNPQLTALAHRLDPSIAHLGTCAVAAFTFTAKSWSRVGRATLHDAQLDSRRKTRQAA